MFDTLQVFTRLVVSATAYYVHLRVQNSVNIYMYACTFSICVFMCLVCVFALRMHAKRYVRTYACRKVNVDVSDVGDVYVTTLNAPRRVVH